MDPLHVLERHLVVNDAARSTLFAYRATARRFLSWCTTSLDEITADDVAGYLGARRAAGADWRRDLTHLRAFFAALVEAGVLALAPTDGMKIEGQRVVPERTLSEDSVRALLQAAQPEAPNALDMRDLAALELLYAVALRASEVCAIQVTDLDLAQGTLSVRPVKRGRPRVLGLPSKALPALRRYQGQARPLLLRRRRGEAEGRLLLTRSGRPLDRTSLQRLVQRRAARAGLHTYPHAIRRSAATHLLRGGVSVRAIQLLLGHRSLDATHAYLSVDKADLRRAVDALDLT